MEKDIRPLGTAKLRSGMPASTSGLYINSGFTFGNFDTFANEKQRNSCVSRKSSRKIVSTGDVTGGVTGSVTGVNKQATNQAVYDLLLSGVNQSEYKTWAQAWISRLSNASLADRITPSKYLPASLPRHHQQQHLRASSSRSSSKQATGRTQLHHPPKTAATSVSASRDRKSAVGRPPRSESPINHTLSASGLSNDVSRRARSLPLLIDQRRILSKYATFNSPRTATGPRISSNSNNSNDVTISTVQPPSLAPSLLPATFRLVTETETPPRRVENYARALAESRKYITFCQPAHSAVNNNLSAEGLSPRLDDNAFVSIPLTEARSSARLRSARASEALRHEMTSFDNLVTNTASARTR